jgi:hypothetical protein
MLFGMEMGRLVRKGRRGAAIPELMCKIQYLEKEIARTKRKRLFLYISTPL